MVGKLLRRLVGGGGDGEDGPKAPEAGGQGTRFGPGAWVAVSGIGARKVREVRPDGSVSLREVERDEKSTITLGPDEARRRLRPLVAKDLAEALRASLAEPSQPNLAENDYERGKAYKSALKSNDLRLMVETLKGIYGHPKPGYPEEHHEHLLAEAAFSELCQVLDVKPAGLRALARKAAGQSVLPDRSAELVQCGKPPELAEHEAIGAFCVENALAVGEGASGIELPARRGVWFAYFLDHEDIPDDVDEDNYPPSRLVCVHSEFVRAFEELQQDAKQESEELPIEGASMAAADAEAAKDKEFQRALEAAGHEVIQGRGVQVRIGGDGRGVAHVARVEGTAVLVLIDLM